LNEESGRNSGGAPTFSSEIKYRKVDFCRESSSEDIVSHERQILKETGGIGETFLNKLRRIHRLTSVLFG
jgi:hypothetical protein